MKITDMKTNMTSPNMDNLIELLTKNNNNVDRMEDENNANGMEEEGN